MSADTILNLDAQTFENVIANGGNRPILVDFWAPWCGPCKAIAPVLEELASEMDSVQICKVDVDNNSELAGKYNVRAIPTLLIFKNGEVVEQLVGLSDKADLKAKLEAHL